MDLRKLSFLILSLLITAPLVRSQTAVVDYEKQIFPILDTYCADCHGADDPDGEFRIDTVANVIAGGKEGVAVKAGSSADSMLVKFLEGRSGRGGKNEFMPPGKRDKLKPEEIALIKAWIDAGAKGPVVATVQTVKPREVITAKIAPKVAPARSIQSVAFSDAVKLIAVGRYGEVELLNPATRAVIRKLSGFKGRVNAVAFSADGASVFGAGGEAGIGGEVQRWRVADGKPMQRYEGHLDACYALTVSPDGKTLATGAYDQKIKLWDVETGKEVTTLKGHNGAIYRLAFRPDGKVLASASADRTVKLWAMPSGQRLDTLSQPTKEQNSVVFSADGKQLFAGGADNRIRVWSISDDAKEGSNSLVTARYAHEGGILNLTLSADGTLLASAATDRSLKIWQTSDLTEKQVLEKQPDWSPALAFGEKSQLITGRVDGSLTVYDPTNGKVVMAAKPVLPAKPEVALLSTRGIRSGGDTTITVTGKNLNPGTLAKFSHVGLKGEIAAETLKPTMATIRVMAEASIPRGVYDLWLSNAAGDSARMKVYVDELAPTQTSAASFHAGPFEVAKLPASLWGTLTETGQHDVFRFPAKAGEELVFDLAISQVGSMAKSPTLEILNEAGAILVVNRGLDSGSDPFIAWKAPADGSYFARVSNTTLDGSPNHLYRLTLGALPYVTGWFPLSAQSGQESDVKLIGPHLGGQATVHLKAGAESMQPLTTATQAVRYRTVPSIRVNAVPVALEKEGNDEVAQAQMITAPVSVQGQLQHVDATADTDCFAFDAKKGQAWIVESFAAQAGSPADTKIEILHPDGTPVQRMLFQAVRDSYNNFRSVDANNPDIRLQNWEEMELNEYVWFNGDIIRTFRMPRGPDSGFLFYGLKSIRRAYFDTTAAAHSLDEPCYTVIPHPLGTALVPNGLPVFTLNYANDDDGQRKLGRDSRIFFTAPGDGRYVVRVTDTRGWSGERFVYSLNLRQPIPDFSVAVAGNNPTVAPGSSMGFSFRADRKDDFDGPIQIEIGGVPVGYYASSPLTIQAGQDLVSGSLHATPGAPKEADWSKVVITAKALVAGKEVAHAVENFGKVTLGPPAKFIIVFEPDQAGKPVMRALADETTPLELTLTPGKTVKCWLRSVRQAGGEGLINLDIHGLPHGVIVDDIGLNGVQIRDKENERPIYLRAAKWVPEQDRLCHGTTASARAEHDSAGLQTSFPILLKIRQGAPKVVLNSGQ